MQTGVINKIPSIDGGWIPIGRNLLTPTGVSVDLSKPPAGVDHTTETYQLPGYSAGAAPHITSGPETKGGRPQLFQHFAFGSIATALQNDAGGIETNRWVRCQIEIIGFSTLQKWVPTSKEQRIQLASFYEWAEAELGIPQRSVYGTTLTAGTIWATETNPQRVDGAFGHKPGWYGHVGVPENDHWDPGSMQRNKLLEPEEHTRIRYQIKAIWRADAHREAEELSNHYTLRRLGQTMATSKPLRDRIREHRAQGHRIEIVRHRLAA